MNNAIIKKAVNVLKISTIAILVAGNMFVPASLNDNNYINSNFDNVVVSSNNLKTSSFLTTDEVKTVAKELGCDISYLRTNQTLSGENFQRLANNGKEPIYITISDAYPAESRELIIKSLDEIFGLIRKVNSCYNYKIVDKVPKGKVFIAYEVKDINGSAGVTNIVEADGDGFNDSSVIYCDADLINGEQSDVVKQYTKTHELLHVLGTSDVYANKDESSFKNVIKSTTYMQTDMYPISHKDYFSKITPNDFKCILSLYAPKGSDIEQLKYMASVYEQEYYDYFVEEFDKQNFYGYEKRELCEDLSFELKKYMLTDYSIACKIKNGKYKLVFADKKGNTLQTQLGDVAFVKGSLVLKNVKLINVSTNIINYEQGDYYLDLIVSGGTVDGNTIVKVGDLFGNESKKATRLEGLNKTIAADEETILIN